MQRKSCDMIMMLKKQNPLGCDAWWVFCMQKGGEDMAKKFKTEKAMWNAWVKFKDFCDNKTVTRTEFSQRTSEFVSATIPAPVTYTIKGFCKFIDMTEANFYATYNKDEAFESVIARMKEECEIDAREKFENNTLNSRLAGLWMSNYGYTTNVNTEVSADISPIVIHDDVVE